VQRFRDLRVWQLGRVLARDVYAITALLPLSERFGLSSQLRRAAVSVLANIAEGSKRRYSNDYAHFLNIAESSVAEIECLVTICEDLEFFKADRAQPVLFDADRLARMLAALRAKVLRAKGSLQASNSRP
jgi:four helix bundle protein